MRVLLTADTVGGVWDYACTLAGALRDEGHDVVLAVLGRLAQHHQAVLPAGVEVAARPYLLEWMQDSDADTEEAIEWVARLAEVWHADVVHLNQFALALGSFSVPTLVVAHSDVLSWFGEALEEEAPEAFGRYASRVRRALRHATAVVSPSLYQSRLLERHYGRGADRVIHNGVKVPDAPPAAEGEPVAVCAARAWDPAKGIAVLDQAVRIAGAAAPPVHLLGSTSGPDGQRFACEHLQVHGAVDRPTVSQWLASAAIYVSPSLYEPFGLAPVEAALAGCALVLSDIGSYRELWDGCAKFFPAGDAPALASLLSELASDPARVDRLAGSALRRARRRYTVERMTGDYLALYADLCSGAPVGPGAHPLYQTV